MIYILEGLSVLLLIGFAHSYWRYRKHKAPLVAIDPKVSYGYFHHLRVVTWATIVYRFQNKFQSKK